MKRMLALLLALMCCVLPAMAEDAAEASTPAFIAGTGVTDLNAPLPEDPLLHHVTEIARRLDVLAESRTFMMNFLYQNEMVSAVSRGNHTQPAQYFHLSGQQLFDALTAGQPDHALDYARLEIRRSLVNMLPELLLGHRDEQERSAISMLARYKVFAADLEQDAGLFILLYDHATPITVYYYCANGAVMASAMFLPDEALEACRDAESVSAWFAGMGMPAVMFEEVQP